MHELELDAVRLAGELHVDAVIPPEALRSELERRLAACDGWSRSAPGRHHGVFPV
jgi:acetyl-CoA carboxylase carboxyltransferase component